jgi:hypothetical protein
LRVLCDLKLKASILLSLLLIKLKFRSKICWIINVLHKKQYLHVYSQSTDIKQVKWTHNQI